MNIYTKSKVVTWFSRKEKQDVYGIVGYYIVVRIAAFAETILQKIVGFEWRMQSRWGQHQDCANLTNNIKQENRHVLEIEANIIFPYALMLME